MQIIDHFLWAQNISGALQQKVLQCLLNEQRKSCGNIFNCEKINQNNGSIQHMEFPRDPMTQNGLKRRYLNGKKCWVEEKLSFVMRVTHLLVTKYNFFVFRPTIPFSLTLLRLDNGAQVLSLSCCTWNKKHREVFTNCPMPHHHSAALRAVYRRVKCRSKQLCSS